MNLDYFLVHLPTADPGLPVLPAGRPGDVGAAHEPGAAVRDPADWRRPRAWWLLGAAIAVLIPTLLYYGGGWLQYGYRYFLDSVPFVIGAVRAGRGPSRLGRDGWKLAHRVRGRSYGVRGLLGRRSF